MTLSILGRKVHKKVMTPAKRISVIDFLKNDLFFSTIVDFKIAFFGPTTGALVRVFMPFGHSRLLLLDK